MRRRTLALVAALLSAGCTDALVGPDPAADGPAMLEQVWHDVDAHYSFFAIKRVNWDSLHRVYRSAVVTASNAVEVANTIGAMLLELKDVHVNLYTYAHTYSYPGYTPQAAPFDPYVVRDKYLMERYDAPHHTMEFGRLAPDIGYVRIPSFEGSSFGDDLDAALAQMSAVRALVLDVRSNTGGSIRNAVDVAGRFVDRERTYAYVTVRNGPGHDDFTPRRAETVSPAGRRFTGPVALLTNRRTYSAAETVTLAMRVLPSVTVVGDSTGGASGSPLMRELPNGWTYRFSQWVQYTPDGAGFEDIGLAPQVWRRASLVEWQSGYDTALDTALVVLRASLNAPQPARAFATSSASFGTISNRSPTIP